MGQSKEERGDTSSLQCPIYSPIRKKISQRRFPTHRIFSRQFSVNFVHLSPKRKELHHAEAKDVDFPFGAAVSIFLPLPLDPYSLDPSILLQIPTKSNPDFLRQIIIFIFWLCRGRGNDRKKILYNLFLVGYTAIRVTQPPPPPFPIICCVPAQRKRAANQPPNQVDQPNPVSAAQVKPAWWKREGRKRRVSHLVWPGGERGPKVAGGTGFDK